MSLTARLERHTTAIGVAVLALLAYVPALASSPGRMPADTKLYLYLDPWGLFGRAGSTFEPDQFAGWVPFQQITYLWPSGPWYLLFDTIGVPDWIAHRLWIGTIMFLAGAGVFWAARLLGVSAPGALAGAAVYQLSPFLLAYISRTSLLLLPWAGLGWIVALTVRATIARNSPADDEPAPWRRRLGAWRDPALIALIVATVGSANATTLAMIVPAPVLWIVHAAWQRRISWRGAVAITARIGVLCTAVSVWWMTMLSVQSRNGPAVLAYTETLGDVSRNATGSEVLRGLGYWLFYQRDPVAATTTASTDYLVSARVMLVSYAVVLVGLAGLVVTSWAQRRFAALCVATGVVLAVGVHPIDDPSPLFSLFVTDDESGLALALRSSTRAVPVFLLGVALGVGALLTVVPRSLPIRAGARPRTVPLVRAAAAVGVVLLAIVNLPSLWERSFVDPAIDRDQDPPAAWAAATDRLDSFDPQARVLQVPGAEFGAFRWGYTTDHPLVGLTAKPVVTRDLLPLGSPAAMDLLFALDDRIQEGTLEPTTIAPIARLLGADVVWLSNDAAFERFRTARPETVDEALTASAIDGLGPVERFGEPVVNISEVDMTDPAVIVDPAVGTPRSPVALVPVDDPVSVIRTATERVVVSGSGDGLIDAAASGLLSGHELIRFSGSLTDEDLVAALADARTLIVTDTNRDQAHHWRGSQDVRGHTEPGGADIDVLVPTSADQRLDVFAVDASNQSVAIQDGPVTAIASAYGEPFAYRPEDRAVMAIDGDPSTAWRVADHGDPVGERIRLTIDDGVDAVVDRITLRQAPRASGGRSIAAVRLSVTGEPGVDVALTPDSLTDSGQVVDIPSATGGDSIEIEITAIAAGQFPLAASLAGVGFSEIDLGLGATTEYVRPPVDGLEAVGPETPLALVFTRWRTDPADPWRADPEPALQRRVALTTARALDATVTLRLDRRASDDALAALLDGDAAVPRASSRVSGGVRQRGAAAADGDPRTSWVTGFDEAVGARLTFPELGELGSTLVVDQPSGPYSPITELHLRRGDVATGPSATVLVAPPDAAGRSLVPLPPEIADGEGPLELTITAVEPRTTIDRRYGDPRTLPAAIAELSATAGIDAVATDPARPVTATCTDELFGVDGAPVALSFATTVGALVAGDAVEATSCEPIVLDAATHDVVEADASSPLSVDRVVLTEAPLPEPAGPSPIGIEVVRNDPRARDVVVDACPTGCWIVLGEGFNEAWSARAGDTTLGPPTLVDGGFNGWLLPPGDTPTSVEFRWTAQRPVTVGLAVSAIAAIACIAVALLGARRSAAPLPRPRLTVPQPLTRRRVTVAGGALVVAAVALIGPLWGAVAAAVAAAAFVLRRPRTFEIAGLAAASAVAVTAAWVLRSERPFPNAGWTTSFEHLNGLAVFAVLVLAVGAAFAPDADRAAP